MSQTRSSPVAATAAAIERLGEAQARGEDVLEAARDLYRRATEQNNARLQAQTQLLIADALHERGDVRGALEAARTAHRLFSNCPNPRGELEALSRVGKFLLMLGDRSEAREVFEQGVDKAEQCGLGLLRGVLLASLAFTYGDAFEPEPYVELTRAAIEEFRDHEDGHDQRLALALTNLGGGLTHLDDLQGAREAYRESIQLARTVGDARVEGLATGGLAEIALMQGRLETARRLTPKARGLLLEDGATWDAIHHGNLMAERALDCAEPELALELSEPLEALLDADFLALGVEYHALRSEAHESLEDYEAALASLQARNRWRERQIEQRDRRRTTQEAGSEEEGSEEDGDAPSREFNETAETKSLQHALAKAQAERRELALAASTDPLTGLFNRRSLESLGRDYIERSRTRGEALAVLVIDLDHFKALNDVHGHTAGDEALRRTADRIRECMRAEDVVARTGGDEMVALLPSTTRQQARKIGERVRERLAAPFAPMEDDRIEMTASVGVAEFNAGETLEEVVKRADRAMYAAKQEGRNRVETAPADGSHTAD